MYGFMAIFLAFFFFSCGKPADHSSDTKQIYTKSIRRDATRAEAKHVLKTETGCTAFWIDNDLDRDLVMTARHCYDYKITEACAAKTKFYTPDGELVAECYRLVAARNDKDVVMIEVRMLQNISKSKLTIYDYLPDHARSLQMIGFPADSQRNGRLTVSENCQTRSRVAAVIRPNSPQSQDEGIYHDCSTYGGNSGGPIIIENTNLVLGLPATYYKEHDASNPIPTETVDPLLLARMDLLKDFVNDHSATLKTWKVKVAQ